MAGGNDDPFGISLTTVSGQMFSIGDCKTRFPVAECARPINFAIALSETGFRKCFQHVGCEPSGQAADSMDLNPRAKSSGEGVIPHNPLVDAGAIMSCALATSAAAAAPSIGKNKR